MPRNTRIAPTPSGLLHIGNAWSFVLTGIIAKQNNLCLHLRIDDMDTVRFRPEYLDDIFHSLDWLGIQWEAGPVSPDDFLKHFRQSDKALQYTNMLNRLKGLQQNRILLAYVCNCTRKTIKAYRMGKGFKQNPPYPGICRSKKLPYQPEITQWRMNTAHATPVTIHKPDGFEICSVQNEMGDFVIETKSGLPAYQICSLQDDTANEVDYIVRGNDLRESTIAQVWLAYLLDLHTFRKAIFFHHNLILNRSGKKLSKSKGALSLQSLRLKHGSSSKLLNLFSEWLGCPGADTFQTLTENCPLLTEKTIPKDIQLPENFMRDFGEP